MISSVFVSSAKNAKLKFQVSLAAEVSLLDCSAHLTHIESAEA
jgi:hypothetical protein